MRVDMHMHTNVSDGTDSPAELLEIVRRNGIDMFSITDHDDCEGCRMMSDILRPGDPLFVNGIEINAKEDGRKYHILGYGFDSSHEKMIALIHKVHKIRQNKVKGRIEFLAKQFGYVFPEHELDALFANRNPGKPHIGNLMVKYGYAPNRNVAIADYINRYREPQEHVTPEEAIGTILQAGGVPVLAHGLFGDGGQNLSEKELRYRVDHLSSIGLRGLECYYSGYSVQQQKITRCICEDYDLLATAGSDYHGLNKVVRPGEHGLGNEKEDDRIMKFLNELHGRKCM